MSNEFIAKNGFISNINATVKGLSGNSTQFLTVTNTGLITGSGFNSSSFTTTATTTTLSGQLVSLISAASGNAYIQSTTTAASMSANALAQTQTISFAASANAYQQSVSYTNVASGNNTSFTSNVSSSLNSRILNLESIPIATTEPNGFENRTDSTIRWDNATKTFYISGNYNVWGSGVKYNKTGNSQTISDITGNHYFYYNSANAAFTYSQNPWNILTSIPIAYAYWDGSTGVLYEERHGIIMDGVTHYYNHFTRGTQYVSGLSINGYVPFQDTINGISYGVSSGIIADEDIIYPITALVSGNNNYNIWYRTGVDGNWKISENQSIPILTSSNNILYNQYTGSTWQLTQLTANNVYANYYLGVTSAVSASEQFFTFPGQTVYNTLAEAQAETISSLSFGILPVQEFLSLYQITFRRANGYSTTTGRSRIEAVSRIIGNSVIINAVQPNAFHNSLAGLQGGTAGEYFHLTSAQYNDYIGASTVGSVSASLLSATYSSSANALAQSNSITYAASANSNIQSNAFTTVVSGNLIQYVNTSSASLAAVAAASANALIQANNNTTAQLISYTTLSATNILTGNLQTQINNVNSNISYLASVTAGFASTSLIASTSAAIVNYDVAQDAAMSGALITYSNSTSANSLVHAQKYSDNLDSNVVHKTGNETVNGNKTFTGATNFNYDTVTINASSDVQVFTVQNTLGTGGQPMVNMFMPVSTGNNNGKLFQFKDPGEGSGRGMFYSDGKYGIGPGSSTRDIFISRSGTNTLRVSNIDASNNPTAGNLQVYGNTTLANGGAFFANNLTTTLSGNILTWDGTQKLIDSGVNTYSLSANAYNQVIGNLQNGTVQISGKYVDLTTAQTVNGNKTFNGIVDINNTLISDKFLLGADLSLIPIAGNQSVLASWWGLQLKGNIQVDPGIVPAAIGNAGDYDVLIPSSRTSSVTLAVFGITGGQTSNLTTWYNDTYNRVPVAGISPNGTISGSNIILTSLNIPNSGNFLTWNASKRLVDSGINLSTILSVSANAYQQSISYTNDVSANLISYINSGSVSMASVAAASANAYTQSVQYTNSITGNFVTTNTPQTIFGPKTFASQVEISISGDGAFKLDTYNISGYTEITWALNDVNSFGEYVSYNMALNSPAWTSPVNGQYWSIFGYNISKDLFTIDVSGNATLSNGNLSLLKLNPATSGNALTWNQNGTLIDSGVNLKTGRFKSDVYTTTRSLSATNYYVVYTGTTSGNKFTLPPANINTPDTTMIIVKHAAKSYYKLSIAPYGNGTDNIESLAIGSSIQMVSGQSLTFISDGISTYYIN